MTTVLTGKVIKDVVARIWQPPSKLLYEEILYCKSTSKILTKRHNE